MWHGAGPGPDLQASCQEGYFLLPSEQASYPKRGLQGFPRPPRPAAPPIAQRPPGLLEVREVLPTRPSVVSSHWCSPPSTLLPPSVDSSCRCCCFGCCVIRPRAARTEGLGPGTPLASTCTPLGAHTQSSRTGDSPRSLGSAPTWLPAAPAVTGKEKAGGPEGGGQGAGGRCARRAGGASWSQFGICAGATQVPPWTGSVGE